MGCRKCSCRIPQRKLTSTEFRAATRHFEMEKEPDFFLSAAGEHRALSTSRACWVKGRLKNQVRDDHMLIEIEPTIIGQPYGLGDKDIVNLILSVKLQGFSLFPVNEWPCPVYVSRILDEAITKTLVFAGDQVEMIAWAVIFRNLDEANAHAKKF